MARNFVVVLGVSAFLCACSSANGPSTVNDDSGGEGGEAVGGAGEGGQAGNGDHGGNAAGGRTDMQNAGDAGSASANGDAGAPDAVVIPMGKVGVFVAAGNGGRTVTSCDDGKTWIAQEVIENANEDHSPYTHKGFAYGDGTFVQVSGWGNYARIKRSRDGVTWQRSEVKDYTFGGLGFSMGAFVGVDSFGSRVSRDGGVTWMPGGPSGHGYHVRGAGGGGPAVAGGGSDLTPVVTWNQGKTFIKATGCPGMDFSNLGQLGGAAFGGNAFVVMSAKGNFCKLVDGKVVKSGSVGGGVIGKVVWAGDHFYAPSVSRAYVSTDGESWASMIFKPVGIKVNVVARSPAGTYVGITQAGTGFYRSLDGVTWEKINGPMGPNLIDLAYGVVDESAMCRAQ
ncbi:MAG: hypothetical protein SF187_29970 [Deltaproteobacteria bacterium]|nr:hypothetical protein [Deltaproteobacteria bacterium]